MSTVFTHQIADDDPILADLTTNLSRLGEMSPAILAGYFEDLGVVGVRFDCDACPVARYLRNTLGVPRAEVTDYAAIWPAGGGMAYCELPKSVKNFVGLFDGGRYPSLIDSSGPSSEERWTSNHDE